MNKILTLVLFLGTLNIYAISDYPEIPKDRALEISERVDRMNQIELLERRQELIQEKKSLETSYNSTQNPSVIRSSAVRYAEVIAELSAIQKVLLATVGAAVIANVTDDGYNDNVPPVITVIGDNPATVELGSTYSDAGASADDAFHGVTTVTSSGTVDVNTVGSYTITYTATDLDNNTATATRTVNVIDTTAPVVTITGDNPATVELGSTYTDAGATASDASGDVTVVTTGTVDADTLGTYTLTYTSTDASGNAGTATRTVNVVDTTAPVFTSSAAWSAPENQTSIGTVTATDLDTVSFTVSGSALNITSSGVLTFASAPDNENYNTITATITASDPSGNTAEQSITVNVRDVDDEAPTIASSCSSCIII